MSVIFEKSFERIFERMILFRSSTYSVHMSARAEQTPVPQRPVGDQREPSVDLLGQRSDGHTKRRGQGFPIPAQQRVQVPLTPEHEAFREIFDPI